MEAAKILLNRLGVMEGFPPQGYQSKLQIVNDFLENGQSDCRVLLGQLGSFWDEDDVALTERWLAEQDE